jgi:hypothetical protein
MLMLFNRIVLTSTGPTAEKAAGPEPFCYLPQKPRQPPLLGLFHAQCRDAYSRLVVERPGTTQPQWI